MINRNRRRWLAGGAAVVASSLVSNAVRGAAQNFANPFTMEDLIRIIGRNDGGVAVRYTDGVLSAHVESTATPLFRVLSQIYSRHRLRADGAYDTVVLELACFADLETREVLTEWRNPFTGTTVPVPKTVLGPTPYVIRPDFTAVRAPQYSGGAPFGHRFDVERHGDDLWLTESLDSVMPSPAPGIPGFGFHENFTYLARAAALQDAQRSHVDAIVQKTNVLGWRPWMIMGDLRGTTVTRAHGRVIGDPTQLPDIFKKINATHGAGIVDELDATLRFTG